MSDDEGSGPLNMIRNVLGRPGCGLWLLGLFVLVGALGVILLAEAFGWSPFGDPNQRDTGVVGATPGSASEPAPAVRSSRTGSRPWRAPGSP
jgi:hypothetical protein